MVVEVTLGVICDEMTVYGPNIPSEIPLIIGDCLQNLRSSLDYLVWELCDAANVKPTEKNAFPVCKDQQAFQSRKDALCGVPPNAAAIIERLQPFNSAQGWMSSELWILNRLTNISKHRRILVAGLGAVRTETATGAVIDRHTQVNHPFVGEIELDYDPVALIKCGEVEGAGEEVSALLHRLANYITHQVIPLFEPLF
jgi:hypothetical protein